MRHRWTPRFRDRARGVAHRIRVERAGTNPPSAGDGAGKVSIVLPAYGVEEYIAEALDSLLAQTYENIEILVIDDGSPDGSGAIAEDYAARDSRVTVFHTANQGLGAARNFGAAQARGEFLWFVDSDDTVAPKAAETFVSTLGRSGSDFAVASYRRLKEGRRVEAGHWIRAAHHVRRIGTDLASSPDILVNAVAWSKCYRRSFWDETGLTFPVGVLYEDQVVSAEAYARARSFDVLTKPLYNWRVRSDGSSISQQTHQIADLRDRFEAARGSLAVLARYAGEEAVRARAFQLLSNDMQHSARELAGASTEWWTALSAGIRGIAAHLTDDDWSQIRSQQAILTWLVAEGDRDAAEEFLACGGLSERNWPTRVESGRVAAVMPDFSHHLERIPLPVRALSPEQLTLTTGISGAAWQGTDLVLEGWAFVALEPDGEPLSELRVRLVDGDSVVPMATERISSPLINTFANRAVSDLSSAGFRARLNLSSLSVQAHPGLYVIEVTATSPTVGELRQVVRERRRGSMIGTTARIAVNGVGAQPLVRDDLFPAVQVFAAPYTASDIVVSDRGFALRFEEAEGTQTPLESDVELYAGPTATAVPPASGSERSGRVVEIDVAGIAGLGPDATLHIDVASEGRTSTPLRCPGPFDDEARLLHPSGVLMSRTGDGRLRLSSSQSTRIVDAIDLGADVLKVSGWRIGGEPGGWLVVDQLAPVQATEQTSDGGDVVRWQAAVPLATELFGEATPLAPGRRKIDWKDASGQIGRLRLSAHLAERLPLDTASPDSLPHRVEARRGRGLVLVTTRGLRPDEAGAFNQERLRTRVRTHAWPALEDAVLFRTYYGESATCSARAIHEELVRRDCDLPLYWTVKDHSVPVPDRAIRVVQHTARWHELLATARYLVDNVHQPDFLRTQPGQTFVQTLHGYPYKLAGVPYWRRSGYSEDRIRSFLERQEDWTYLLSPAPYATPLLARDFPFGGEMLEIGYPRNDIFFHASRADDVRARTRARLGIGAHQTAVLYAPTYRDNLSIDEFRANRVDFLDPAVASTALGPDYVFLMRGHAMNARVAKREDTTATVIDVTDYPEIVDLTLAADVGILDYSSLRFDFALTGKPMLFLVPDLEDYTGDVRGALLPYADTAPGPFLGSTAEVVEALQDLDTVAARHEAQRAAFIATFMPLEDGQASARLVDRVFDR